MKVNLLLYTLYFVIMNVAPTCCQKDKITYVMDQEFKDYIVFNPGSYWVYQDSTDSTNIDSIALASQKIEIVEGNHTPYKWERLWQTYYAYKSVYLTNNSIRGGVDPVYLDNYILNIGGIAQFFSKRGIGSIDGGEDLLYENYLDSLIIKNKSYKKIKVFKLLYNSSNLPIKIYYAQNIGIIKKEMFDGTVWELVRYNVSQ